jgi:hypothetical protein
MSFGGSSRSSDRPSARITPTQQCLNTALQNTSHASSRIAMAVGALDAQESIAPTSAVAYLSNYVKSKPAFVKVFNPGLPLYFSAHGLFKMPLYYGGIAHGL